VFYEDDNFPSEVFCRVVVPEFFRRPGPVGGHRTDQINAINDSMTRLAQEFISFVGGVRMKISESREPGADVYEGEDPNTMTAEKIREFLPNFPDFTTDFSDGIPPNPHDPNSAQRGQRDTADSNNRGTNLSRTSPLQYCSIERIYSEIFQHEAMMRDFNSKQNLDDLFSNSRGSLIKYCDAPPTYADSDEARARLIRKNKLSSKNYLYQTRRNEQGKFTDDPAEFHRTIFSLKNIINQFMDTRTPGSFYDVVNRREYNALSDSNMPYGEEAQQTFPLAQHFDKIFINPKTKLNGNFDVDQFGIGIYSAAQTMPGKSYWNTFNGVHGRHDYYIFSIHDDDFRSNWSSHIEFQPNIIYTVPHRHDVQKFSVESYRYPWGNQHHPAQEIDVPMGLMWNSQDSGNIVGTTSVERKFHQVGKGFNETTNQVRQPGIKTDGMGRDFCNYNKVVYTPFEEYKTSLYHADGFVSFNEISTFIKICIRDVMIESANTSDIAIEQFFAMDLDPERYFNYGEFFSSGPEGSELVNFRLMSRIIQGAADFSVNEDSAGVTARELSELGYSSDLSSDLGRFDFSNESIFRDQYNRFESLGSIPAKRLENMINMLIDMFDGIHRLAGNQANFMHHTEVLTIEGYRNYLGPIFWSLAYSRILKKIRKDGYTPRESLCMLSMLSCYHVHNILTDLDTYEYSGTTNEQFLIHKQPWATCCAIFLLLALRGTADQNTAAADTTLVSNPIFPYTNFRELYLSLVDGGSADDGTDKATKRGTEGWLKTLMLGYWPESVKVHDNHRINFPEEFRANTISPLEYLKRYINRDNADAIIRLANETYAGLMKHAIDDGAYPPGNLSPGHSNNNNFIFRVITDPAIWNKVYDNRTIPGSLVDLFNSALDSYLAFDSQSFVNISTSLGRGITNYNRAASPMSEETGAQIAIQTGRVESFLDKLNFNLFTHFFLLPSKDYQQASIVSGPFLDMHELNRTYSSQFRGNRRALNWQLPLNRSIFNFLQNDEHFLSNYLRKNYPEINSYLERFDPNNDRFLTATDFYDGILGHISRNSPTLSARMRNNNSNLSLIERENVNISNRFNIVNYEDTTFKNAFSRHTGITAGMLNAGAFSHALINGQIVTDLLENSTISQVSRLCINIPDRGPQTNPRSDAGPYRDVVNNFITIQNLSEEFRSFKMISETDGAQRKIFSVPISEAIQLHTVDQETGEPTSPWSPIDYTFIDCMDWEQFEQRYYDFRKTMSMELIKSPDTKRIFEYIFPVKRYQSIATVFATSALAGYGSMTSIMQTPKASLASILSISSMNSKERNAMFQNYSQADLYKTLLDNASSNPESLSCFDLPFDEEFFKQFLDMLLELIKQFPSIFFRGIANVIDPAYKEMKIHWDQCEIDKLTWEGVRGFNTTVENKELNAGLWENQAMQIGDGIETKRDGKYADFLATAPTDLLYSTTRVAATLGMEKKAWVYLGRAIDRTVAYIYKGPVALLSGPFNFQIPCADPPIDENWELGPFNTGRYGHPISPLTAIALSTPELKGDKRLRDSSGACKISYSLPDIVERECDPRELAELSPFGAMPKPEEE
tara:strand:+ start:80 stop:4795 length:4716 start_codon:yes stop_codon:yes gene_type:complete